MPLPWGLACRHPGPEGDQDGPSTPPRSMLPVLSLGAQGARALPPVRGGVLSPPPPGPAGDEVTFKPVVLCGTQTFQAPGKCIGMASFDRRLRTQLCVGPRQHVGPMWRPVGKRLPAARLGASQPKPPGLRAADARSPGFLSNSWKP